MKKRIASRLFSPVVSTLSAFLVCLFALVSVQAQAIDATVNGTIKDQAGAVVAGASVTLIDSATGRETTVTTNDEGFYVFQNVRPGTYSLRAQHAGFKKHEVPGVKVDVATPATVNFDLVPGGLEETVTVSASEAAVPINSTNGELTSTVREQQINDLPLNGRNPLTLAGLQPGVKLNF